MTEARSVGASPRIETAASVLDVPPGEWERISTGCGLYVSRPWLASLESDRDHVPHYLLARDADGLILGALPAYHVPNPGPKSFYNPYFLFGTDTLLDGGPVLLVGTKAGYTTRIPVRPDLPRQTADWVRKALLAAALDLGSDLGVTVVALQYLTVPETEATLPHLPDALVLSAAPDSLFELPRTADADMDGFFATQSSSRRRTMRREMRRFAREGYTTSTASLAECYERIAPLFANLIRRHRGGDSSMVDYLRRQAHHLDSLATTYLVHHHGELVAFSLFYSWEEGTYARLYGELGDDPGERGNVYYNAAYYTPIADFVSQRRAWISYGPEAYGAKFNRGARPDPRWSVLVPLRDEEVWREAVDGWNERRTAEWNAEYGHDERLQIEPLVPGAGPSPRPGGDR
ncbi:GNAT family N-acetyltransferase [Streptomyces tibetensis]|uniref:GNAT family N-acetyltransferase n=1 Tax=Streptomyces tibetensis TaxID=2382123 RepID=UPI0033DEED96